MTSEEGHAVKTLWVMLQDITPGRDALRGLLFVTVLMIPVAAVMGLAALLQWATGLPGEAFIFGALGVFYLAWWVGSARERAHDPDRGA